MVDKVKPKRKLSKRATENPHYVNNKEFTEAVAAWIAENSENDRDKNRTEWTPMTEYIAICIMKIVNHYALKPRWRGYTYIDEMRSEAILTCVKYAHNFNVEKSNNAFSYFTQITEFSFRQIWNNEDTQSKIKFDTINEQSMYSLDKINLYDEDAAEECKQEQNDGF
jgi:hypothetical protein